MKSPFHNLMAASRLAQSGRPLSAALALQRLLLAPTRPGKPRRTASPLASRSARAAPLPRPAPGAFIDGRFDGPHGALAYKLYAPRGSTRRRLPLVVMLHGCGQSANDFAIGAGMNALADEYGFLALYPEQTTSANLARCWNWHRPGDQTRGGGEPATLAALTRRVIAAGD